MRLSCVNFPELNYWAAVPRHLQECVPSTKQSRVNVAGSLQCSVQSVLCCRKAVFDGKSRNLSKRA